MGMFYRPLAPRRKVRKIKGGGNGVTLHTIYQQVCGSGNRRWTAEAVVPPPFFYERYQNFGQLLTQSKRFYPIISKTKGVAPKIKLLIYHVTRRDISPPPLSWDKRSTRTNMINSRKWNFCASYFLTRIETIYPIECNIFHYINQKVNNSHLFLLNISINENVLYYIWLL